MNFAFQLKLFLEQSETTNLKTKHFVSEYLGLKVKVGFGQGSIARITWVSFLADGQTTSKGIYPVYLYFKAQKLLVLAYGVSETNEPPLKWHINNPETVSEFFKKANHTKPERYGSSFIYKVYNIDDLPDEDELNEDLSKIIEEYKVIIDANALNKTSMILKQVKFDSEEFYKITKQANLQFSHYLISRFISSLITKPFVILTGLSGSGKTKLAQAFSSWICEDDSQYCIVPVGADWTNREPLLGFPNALIPDEYIMPQNGALKLIIESKKEENKNKPYFLILDEMNLSHVERYFADFLSAMESKSDIELHSIKEEKNKIPSKISLPSNLFIIGTVNIDETTYMFSPKVLDRASVIEFRVLENEMKAYLDTATEVNMESIKNQGAGMGQDFVAMASEKFLTLQVEDTAALNKSLLEFFLELKKTGSEFGYRSASEILRFAAVIRKLNSDWTIEMIIDAAIMQKLLPKVHGSRKKLAPVLEQLGSLCLKESQVIKDIFDKKETPKYEEIAKYQTSLEKITRMYHNLLDNGFTSYAEA